MATFAKLDNSKPVNYAWATEQPTPGGTGPCMHLLATPIADKSATIDAVLNTKYKTAGTTAWETVRVSTTG